MNLFPIPHNQIFSPITLPNPIWLFDKTSNLCENALMNNLDDKSLFDKTVKKTLEGNTETLKEINRLLKVIDEIKTKNETLFKEFRITPELETKNTSLTDLSVTEQTLFSTIQNEFFAELHAKGININPDFEKNMNLDLEKNTTSTTKTNLLLSRKRIRI